MLLENFGVVRFRDKEDDRDLEWTLNNWTESWECIKDVEGEGWVQENEYEHNHEHEQWNIYENETKFNERQWSE